MKTEAKFYHAGSPVRADGEQIIIKYDQSGKVSR
jgi:hypothetical protein